MRLLYPRTVSISRPAVDSGVGAQGYSGLRQSTETATLSNIRAHIESDRQGTVPDARIAGDVAGQSIWLIIMRKIPLGAIKIGDIITSEIGDRYQVISPDWGPLVTTCRCQIMKT